MKFKAREGSRLTDEQAGLVGQYVESLKKQLNRHPDADDFIDALPRKGALFRFLQRRYAWEDDGKLAEEQRRNIARALMRSYTVTVIREDREIDVRGVHFLDSTGGYTDIATIVTDTDMVTELLKGAKKDALAFHRRYAKLRELLGPSNRKLLKMLAALEEFLEEDIAAAAEE